MPECSRADATSRSWKRTTATCRTSSSRSSAASCGCCRPATASAPPRRRCASPSTWPNEGLITRKEAVLRVDPASLDQLLHPTIDPRRARRHRLHGLPASPGAATGESSSAPTRPRSAPKGEVILVRGSRPARKTSTACTPPRHPDRARRHDQPRGRGGARHGPALRVGRGRRSASTMKRGDRRPARQVASRPGDVITIDGATGEVCRRRADGRAGTVRRFAAR
jgi:hypothetical protein